MNVINLNKIDSINKITSVSYKGTILINLCSVKQWNTIYQAILALIWFLNEEGKFDFS